STRRSPPNPRARPRCRCTGRSRGRYPDRPGWRRHHRSAIDLARCSRWRGSRSCWILSCRWLYRRTRPESERTERGRRQRGSETISSWGDSILLVGTIRYAYSLPSLKVLYIQLVEGANAVRGENPCLFPVRSVRASLGRCTVLMQVKCSRGG